MAASQIGCGRVPDESHHPPGGGRDNKKTSMVAPLVSPHKTFSPGPFGISRKSIESEREEGTKVQNLK